MNILIFNWRDLKHSWAGGGEIYIFEMAKRWVKEGHNVTVFCGEDKEKKLPAQEKYDNIKIIRKGGRYTLYIWAIIYYFKHFRSVADLIVDVQNGIPFFTPIYSRKPKISFIYHVHDRQFFYELRFPVSIVGYVVERYIAPIIYKKTKIIAISETTKKELIKLGYKTKSIQIVYCGIGKNNILKDGQKKYSSPTLLYLGRIKAYKRVNKLVEVFENLLKERPNVNLIIAGWGTEASTIVDTIMKSKYRKKIRLLGPVSEIEKRALLSKAWVFVNLSIGEGWGISVIEANRHGTPAIAFNVPGLSESIIHSKTGLLAKNDDELLKYIKKIVDDSKFRNKLSKNAQEWSNNFNWDNAAKLSLQILTKTVQKKGSR